MFRSCSGRWLVDATAVGVVLIRDSRAHNPHYIIFGAKVQKIFDICKIFVFTKIIERSEMRNSFAFRGICSSILKQYSPCFVRK